MQSHVLQRLSAVLRRHKTRLGSWNKLADDIEMANDRLPERRIDRRTLEKLCTKSAEDVQLKLAQLLALDAWFSICSEGSLLTREHSLLDSVCESYNVNFLVAAKHLPEMHDDAIARFDLRAITRLLRTGLNRLRVGIWDVTGPENWRSSDTRITNAANIAIGSPAANYASEMVMRRMIGLPEGKVATSARLPFFIVGAERDKRLNSIFIRSPEAEALRNPGAGPSVDRSRRSLVVNDNWYVSTEQEDHALLLAQRNPDNGQVQMVLCGLTGQGTYQLARQLQAGQPQEIMPPLRGAEKNPPILVMVFKLSMAPNPDENSRDTHQVIGIAPTESPRFVHHVSGEWQFLR